MPAFSGSSGSVPSTVPQAGGHMDHDAQVEHAINKAQASGIQNASAPQGASPSEAEAETATELESGLAGMKVDENGQLLPVLEDNQEIVPCKDFPNDWPGTFKHPQKNVKLDTNNWAVTSFDDLNGKVFGRLRQNPDAPKPFLKISWNLCTQRPALKIQVRRDDKDVLCHIFPNSVVRDLESGTCFMSIETEESRRQNFPREIREMVDSPRDLLMIELQLWQNSMPTPDFGAPPRRPGFDGIAQSELERFSNVMCEGSDADIAELDEAEQFLGALYYAQHLQVCVIWPDGGNDVLRQFTNRTKFVFNMCARNDNLWFYHAQRRDNDPPIHSPDFDLKDLKFPRWMAKEFLAEKDAPGLVVSQPQQIEYASFPFAAMDQVFATADDAAFELRLAIVRDRAYQSHIINSSFQTKDYSVRGTFRAHPRMNGCYVIELRSHNNSLLDEDKTMRPQPNSRVRVEVARPGNDASGDVDTDYFEADVFEGIIIDDIWNSRAEVVCIVRGPTIDLSRSNLRQVLVELLDDSTPADRWKAAIEEIQRGVSRDQDGSLVRNGVDIPNIVLRAPPTIKRTDSLAAEVSTTPTLKPHFDKVLQHYGVNAKQREAAEKSLASAIGITLIQGPSGCGKTHAAMAIAVGHIQVGKNIGPRRRRPVLACAPSNAAVNAMLDKVLANLDPVRPLEIIRYKGSFLKEKRERQSTEPGRMEADDQHTDEAATRARELEEALWELADDESPFGEETHQDYAFHVRRLRAIRRWHAVLGHEMRPAATEYLELRERLRDPADLDRQEKQRNKAGLQGLEEDLSEYYLQNEVDMVFCTNSASAYGLLRRFYQPKVLISNEAAMTTLPDAATPMAAFIDYIETLVVTGDLQQQQPIIASRGKNEFYNTLVVSLFRLIFNATRLPGSFIELVEQHRMHPDISAPLSRLFYTGSLVDSPAVVNRTSRIWATLETMLNPLKPAYNGRRRLCIDISGEGVASQAFNGTTTHFNAHEALATVEFIKRAVAQEPPPNGAWIQPSDFLVLSPYSGQTHVIRDRLVRERISVPGNKVRIASTRSIQGEEAPFVIMTFTRNEKGHPLRLGLASEPHGLCVGMSRPQECLIMIGNWKGWQQAYEEGAPLLHNSGGKMHRFGQIIHDCWSAGDIVSAGDFRRFIANEGITEPEFPKLIRTKRPGGKQSGADNSHKSTRKSQFDKCEREQRKRRQARGGGSRGSLPGYGGRGGRAG